ncbi:MAG: hypothetical protein B7Z71_03650 [Acidocella sp. 21-58-7]|nr:MAG: hypothetical protein B7Z71_03650 [Acidocella sp. 21-58-7]
MEHVRNRRIFAAATTGLVQRGAQILATLITYPLVLHDLGVAGFGVWAAATSLAWLAGNLDFGLGAALISLIPRSMAEADHKGRDYVAAVLIGSCLIAITLLGVVVLAIAFGWLPQFRPVFLIAAIALWLSIPLNAGNNIWFGLQKAYVPAGWQLAQTILTLLLVSTGALCQAGVSALTAAIYAPALATSAAILTHAFISYPNLRPSWHLSSTAMRTVLTQGSQLFAITLAATSAYAFDTLFALHWLGAAAAAQMAIALRICTTASGLLGIITMPFWPGFADALSTNDHAWLTRTLRHGTIGVITLAVFGSFGLFAGGGPILRLWLHHDFQMTPLLLGTMAAWIIVTTAPNIASLFLNAKAILKPQILILISASIISISLKCVFAARFGVPFILAATPLVWLILVIPGYGFLTARCLGKLPAP